MLAGAFTFRLPGFAGEEVLVAGGRLPEFAGAFPLLAGGFTFRLPGFAGEEASIDGGRLLLPGALP